MQPQAGKKILIIQISNERFIDRTHFLKIYKKKTIQNKQSLKNGQSKSKIQLKDVLQKRGYLSGQKKQIKGV